MQAPTVVADQQSQSAPTRPRLQPPYHVILKDDDDHTYDYVIEMLQRLFGLATADALRLTVEIDTGGQVVVDTTTFERAEFKRDQIHGYGRDWRVSDCAGSMSAVIEPAE